MPVNLVFGPDTLIISTNSSTVGAQPQLNLIAGTGITITGSNNTVTNSADITVNGVALTPFGGIASLPTLTTTAAGYQNQDVIVRISAGNILVGTASSWTVGINITAGTATLGTAAIMRTAPQGTTILSSASITFGGISSGAILNVGNTTSDVINFNIDTAHDYYIGFYFQNVASNASVVAGFNNVSNHVVGYIPTGDKITGASTTTGFGSISAQAYLLFSWIKIS